MNASTSPHPTPEDIADARALISHYREAWGILARLSDRHGGIMGEGLAAVATFCQSLPVGEADPIEDRDALELFRALAVAGPGSGRPS